MNITPEMVEAAYQVLRHNWRVNRADARAAIVAAIQVDMKDRRPELPREYPDDKGLTL